MRALTLFCCVAFLAHAYGDKVDSVFTNADFYDAVKDYVTDEEIIDYSVDDSDSDVDDDVIALPGGPDDELDLVYIADRLGLLDRTEAPRGVGWFRRRRHHHHHHHHHHHKPTFSCHCRHYDCGCCLHHTFKVNLIFKKIRFKLHACVNVAYLPRNYGFEITFTMNGRRLLHKELSLRHPPALCFGVPGLRTFARVCLQFYNIDFHTKRICTRIVGVLDLKFKKFKVHLKLGCFRIPILSEEMLESLLNDRDLLNGDMQASAEMAIDNVKPRDLADMFLELPNNAESTDDLYDQESEDSLEI